MSGFKKGTVKKVSVEHVIDGDTVRVRRGGLLGWVFPGPSVRVRLYGIDAPESLQKNGDRSTKALRKMMRSGGYRMEVMDTDRYGRVVGLFHRGDRYKSVNYEMVKEGWAHAYVRYGGRELGMEEAERRAREKRLGIWKGQGPSELPEAWRRRQDDGNLRRWFRAVCFLPMLAGLVLLAIWWLLNR